MKRAEINFEMYGHAFANARIVDIDQKALEIEKLYGEEAKSQFLKAITLDLYQFLNNMKDCSQNTENTITYQEISIDKQNHL